MLETSQLYQTWFHRRSENGESYSSTRSWLYGENEDLSPSQIHCHVYSLEITVWVVPSIIENALAVSFIRFYSFSLISKTQVTSIGFLLGPMFPILVNHTTRILPSWLVTGSVALISGFAFCGSAALPFITGILASKYGISSLQPLYVLLSRPLAVSD
jgi:fucose permease